MTGRPFEGAGVVGVGGMDVEFGPDIVRLRGSLDIGRSQDGLEKARQLRGLLDGVVRFLEMEPYLPASEQSPIPPTEGRNPFG